MSEPEFTCTKCGTAKPESEFTVAWDPALERGRRLAACKRCRATYNNIAAKTERDELRAQGLAWNGGPYRAPGRPRRHPGGVA